MFRSDLVDEKIFASQYPGPVVLNIQLPPDVSSNQTGGLLSIMLPSLLAMVKDIKDEIAAQLKSQVSLRWFVGMLLNVAMLREMSLFLQIKCS